MKNYRGNILVPAAYETYAHMFRNNLEEQVERKQSIPHNETGFRERIGRVNNIFVLNFLVNKYLDQNKGNMVNLFKDFNAAFDFGDRKVL